MMGYKDMTFCRYKDCKKFNVCYRALNEKVLSDAKKWWGKEGAPIIEYAEKPECYNGDKKGNNNT